MLLKVDDKVWKSFVQAVGDVQDDYQMSPLGESRKGAPRLFSELPDSNSATAVIRKAIVGGHDAVFF